LNCVNKKITDEPIILPAHQYLSCNAILKDVAILKDSARELGMSFSTKRMKNENKK